MKPMWRLWLLRIYLRIYLVFVPAFLIYDAARRHDPWPVLFGGGVILIPFSLLFPPLLKQTMIKSLPADLVPVPVSPDDFPLLDRSNLEEITAELQSLGFVSLCDYSLSSEAVKNSTAFARVMLHEEYNCFVEINQYFPLDKAWLMSVHFKSFFGDAPRRMTFELPSPAPLPSPGAPPEQVLPAIDFWLYSTHNQRRYLLGRLWRHSRLIGRRICGVAPAEMFRRHLAEREKVAARVELPLVRDLSIEHYFIWGHWMRGVYRQQLRRTNFYFALPRAFFGKRDEWWGELGHIEPSS